MTGRSKKKRVGLIVPLVLQALRRPLLTVGGDPGLQFGVCSPNNSAVLLIRPPAETRILHRDRRGELFDLVVRRFDGRPRSGLERLAVSVLIEDIAVDMEAQRRVTSLVTVLQNTAHDSEMDAILDKFGKGVMTYSYDEEHFCAMVDVVVSNVFYGWIFGFGGKVKILSPEVVKKKYIDMINTAKEEHMSEME